jgi:divalent metal cation (Fe/Co/Zn/Cd) transporter
MTARGPNVCAAAPSVVSNSVLILLKMIAASITGSVAHRTAHELQEEIGGRLPGTDVLIHLEPQDRVRPGEGS